MLSLLSLCSLQDNEDGGKDWLNGMRVKPGRGLVSPGMVHLMKSVNIPKHNL
jgi:hypothetical protein